MLIVGAALFRNSAKNMLTVGAALFINRCTKCQHETVHVDSWGTTYILLHDATHFLWN